MGTQIGLIWLTFDPSEEEAKRHLQGVDPDSWSMQIVRAAERAIFHAGLHLVTLPYMVSQADPIASLLRRIDQMQDNLAGLLIFARAGIEPLTAELDRREIPWVTFNRLHHASTCNFVTANNLRGGWRVGRCLVRRGCRRVLLLSTPTYLSVSHTEKLLGIYRAFMDEGVSTRQMELVTCSSVDEQKGYDAVAHYLSSGGQIPQAVFATGDLLALGAMRACRERGLRIPEDVGIIGSTDMRAAALAHPPLTVLAQPMADIGQQAVQLLLSMRRSGTHRIIGRQIPSPLIFHESFPVPDDLACEMEQMYQQEVKAMEQERAAVIAEIGERR